MKWYSLAFLLLSVLSVGAQEEASTGDVRVEFMGASGGMKVFTLGDDDKFLMVQQGKLEEVTSSGEKCRGGGKDRCSSINVAGKNSWTPVTSAAIGESDDMLYTTTFSVTEGDVTLELTARLTTSTTTVMDFVPCSGCNSTTGNSTTDVCKRTPGNAESNGNSPPSHSNGVSSENGPAGHQGDCVGLENGECPDKYIACKEETVIKKNDLEFAIQVSGFEFQDPSNQLAYSLILKDKTGAETSFADGKVIYPGEGEFSWPPTANIEGTSTEKREVPVSVTPVDNGEGKVVINFLFPSFASTETLYYDPTVSMDEAGSTFTKGAIVCAAAIMALFY